ncbi:probable E3 ubiquitin-protein ligase RHB1A [Rutidosis leptorrhynchoides]|uniref:probable E3 ubiquitin-protein ligase RHB1A n=1 Tax=Rutidosis leptorrhynchoides TaxID=125765 RepID=UPI003A990461
MGCCCSSNRVEWNDSSPLYNPLSSRTGAAPVIPTGLIVDTNLDTSIPDTFRHLPAPIPYDTNPQDQLNNQESSANKIHPPVQTNNIEATGEIEDSNSSENVTKEAIESVTIEEVDAELDNDDELKKSNAPFVAPEECPTCLEEYDEENPKIMTKCEHHFHLSCILEWMERSNTCPVCDQNMEVNFPIAD